MVCKILFMYSSQFCWFVIENIIVKIDYEATKDAENPDYYKCVNYSECSLPTSVPTVFPTIIPTFTPASKNTRLQNTIQNWKLVAFCVLITCYSIGAILFVSSYIHYNRIIKYKFDYPEYDSIFRFFHAIG